MKTLKQEPKETVGFLYFKTFESQQDNPEEPFLSCTSFAFGHRIDQKTCGDPFQF